MRFCDKTKKILLKDLLFSKESCIFAFVNFAMVRKRLKITLYVEIH